MQLQSSCLGSAGWPAPEVHVRTCWLCINLGAELGCAGRVGSKVVQHPLQRGGETVSSIARWMTSPLAARAQQSQTTEAGACSVRCRCLGCAHRLRCRSEPAGTTTRTWVDAALLSTAPSTARYACTNHQHLSPALQRPPVFVWCAPLLYLGQAGCTDVCLSLE